MKQTVEEAAYNYLQKILESSDFEINFEEDNYDAGARDAVLDVTERAYIAGANWRINSVWHDASERPDKGKMLIVEDIDSAYDLVYLSARLRTALFTLQCHRIGSCQQFLSRTRVTCKNIRMGHFLCLYGILQMSDYLFMSYNVVKP